MSRIPVTHVTHVTPVMPGCHVCHASIMAGIKRDRHPLVRSQTMQMDTYLTLHSGTANANDFTSTLNPSLMVGECWEVAVTQVHLPGDPSPFKAAFQGAFPNNPVLGELEIHFKTSACNDLTQIGTGKKSVRLNDILGDLTETTTKRNVLNLNYIRAWNEMAKEKTPGKGMVLRKNNGDFMPQVFKDTPRGLKLEATAPNGGYMPCTRLWLSCWGCWMQLARGWVRGCTTRPGA